jgi:hypothetical protein
VNANHAIIIKTFEEEVNSPLKKTIQKQLTKKRPILFGGQTPNFFVAKHP